MVGSKTISILPLGPLEVSDSDIYQCKAYTSDPSALTGNINLTVLGKLFDIVVASLYNEN